ncbi:DNA polymerase III subunit gamma/tau [Myxococcota bacterium]
MSYVVLARKWRPASFDEVIGQEGVVRTLENAISMDRVAHAYLFCGARGVGKTSVARILAKALNCEEGPTPKPDNSCTSCTEITRGVSPDVFEIDGASNTGVDDVRSLRENSQYLPARSRFKIYIIDEVHMLSTSAFNALLKTLEEPPRHVKFIFATTEPHKIPLTVLSRCQRFDFKRIPSDVILEQMKKILAKEKAEIELEGIQAIAREAAGSMRDALSLTDQVLAFGGEQITAEQVYEALGLAQSGLFSEVIQQVVDNRPDQLMQLVEKLFDEGHDLKRFLEGLLWHVRHLILYRSLEDPDSLVSVLEEERNRLREQAQCAEALRWHQIFDVLARALDELGRSPYPRLVVETALLRLSAIEPLVAVDDLFQQVQRLASRMESGEKISPGSPKREKYVEAFQKRVPPQKKADQPAPAKKSSPADSRFPKGWQDLVAFVSKKKPSIGSVLNHARPLEVSPEQVRIALIPGSFFADQMKNDRNKKDLQQICRDFFRANTKLVVETSGEEAGPTLSEAREQERKQTEDSIKKDSVSHPSVQEAIRVFGAEVEQVRIKKGKDS